MKRSLTVPLYVLMVFLSGVLVGSVGYRLYSAKSVISAAPATAPKPEEWRKRMVNDMRTRLKLSTDQVGKLQTVLDETKQNFAAYDLRTKAERKAIIEEQHQKIRNLLSDTQRTDYDKMLEERAKRRAEQQQQKTRQ